MFMKTSKSRLTGSRKKWRAVCPGVDWRDDMNNHCRRLDTLAELLEACGQPLEPAAAEGIGYSVRQEVEAMKVLLNQLEPPR
jgi:hypothetical protein